MNENPMAAVHAVDAVPMHAMDHVPMHAVDPVPVVAPDGAPEQSRNPRESVEAPVAEVPDSKEAHEYRSEWNQDEDEGGAKPG